MPARCQVSVGGLLGAKHPWSINYNYSVDRVPTATEALTIANAIMASISGSTTIKAALNSGDTYASVRVTGYTALTGPASVSATSTASAVVGTSAIVVPPQVCVVATLRTDAPGRSYRGRLYMPLRAYAVTADGSVSSSVRTSINGVVQAIAQDIDIAFAGSGIASAWVVYSKTVPAVTPVTSVSIGDSVDTQRRRVEVRETYTNFPVT